ncbi:TonB-dependent receptor [Chondrinema litorale]|uniref:TonB-dependent receptor n=1 Tax=Chondrinema litorale TaxID=2994555 RepID=UPI0025426D92|nr:TonB-dependent receptor [Chondrinema litorale]UZR98706.1 TonB-dependent receptor plug domain-containing protein [Chondrinema litorale]
MKYLSTIILCCLVSSFTYAQAIKGKVKDSQKKPIEGAHVLSLKTGSHVHTNHAGSFIFNDVKIGDTLQISHIGFNSVRISVENLTEEIDIQLEENVISLDEIYIQPELDAINLLSEVDLHTNPVNSSQEVLRKVPGLIIGQHAGGGKAEQIFLRGFDIDHGTDLAVSVDGMPVNMVSHAHGQGYADLHFIIPETIENLNFGKGPYYAEQGNFNTAGYVDFQTKKSLKNGLVKVEAGQYNSQRMLAMFNLVDTEKHSAYMAGEYVLTDGPFDSPQNFSRINWMGRYTGRLDNNDEISLSASYFTSNWDASGQVPQRAIDAGLISRFGAIDDTEGGKTSRKNINLNYIKNISNHAFVKNTVFFSQYDFELYSNFTFFLDDPENGDQIKQKESRQLFGMKSEYNQSFKMGLVDALVQGGLGFRNDQSNGNELSHTLNRTTTLDSISLGDINETNMFTYINANFEIGKWTINPSIRIDGFKFNYYDKLLETYETQSESKATVSPKLNILYNYSNNLQLYLKTGKGFHSNDTRVVVAEEGNEILPAAYGADLGAIWKPVPKVLVNAAYWYLFLEQEFVYVGDAGIVEPSGKTRRMGVDLSLRYQPLDWLYWNADVNYTLARAVDETEGNDYIPLAPDFTIMSGLSAIHPSGFYGGLRMRYIDDRPANEDNSIIAKGYTVFDMNAGYQWSNFDLGISIQNLFDVDWNETQFATESRLSYETAPVEEIHFTPGTPFYIKGTISYKF